jgi:hypothetical protein
MSNGRVACPAVAVVDCGIRQLERNATPDPVAARALLRLARQVELDTGEPSAAVPWLADYIAACTAVGVR